MAEEKVFDPAEARAYILGKFREQGDFLILDAEVLEEMVARVQALDEEFMQSSGVDDGGVYDDDAACDFMQDRMKLAFPEHKMYMMRLVEDYMDYSEEYLDSIGAIDWE